METSFDAVIIGAGPAGSAAAIWLARAGWSVALVEKQAFPRRKVCGECMAASNRPLLDALGIGAAFEDAAGPELRQVALMCGEHTLTADLPAAEHPGYAWGRALGRETLDTLLLEEALAAGAQVFQPWTVKALEGGAGAWRCELRGADAGASLSLHSPVAIAAHGSWESLPSERPHRRGQRSGADLLAFKANFRGAALQEGLLPVLCFDGGYGGMVVADGGVTTVACCVRRDRLEAWRAASPGSTAGDVVEAMLRRACGGVQRALRPASRDGPWLSAGPLDPGVRLSATDGLLRIGNAAGEAHPIIGEGMSMALQSASLLCAQLLRSERRSELSAVAWQREVSRRYCMQWRHHFARRLRLASAFAQLAMRPRGAAALVAVVSGWPAVLTLGARWGGKTRSVPAPFTPMQTTYPRGTS